MAKVYTATDLKMEKLVFKTISGDIYDSSGAAWVILDQTYCYVDSEGNSINQLGRGFISISNDISNLPIEVEEALKTLDTYIKTQALLKEGI